MRVKRADRPRVGASAPEFDDAPSTTAPNGRHRPGTSTERIDRAIRGGDAVNGARRAPTRAPSWGRVLVSTARVWLGRKLPSRTVRRVGAVAVAVVIVVGGAVAVLATRTADPRVSASAGVDPDAAARTAAAAWIAHDVRHGTRMACEQIMCARLRSTGVSGGDLVEIGGDATKLSGARLVVATRGVRERFGTALAYSIAPDVLGIFGVGPSRVEVRERSTQSLAAHDKAKTREQHNRQRAALQLLNVPRVHSSSNAMHELAAGEVDNRIVFTLARLARRHTIDVAAFSGRGPFTGIDVPERTVDIDQVDGSAAIGDNPAMRDALAVVHAQTGVYRTASARLIGSGDAGGVLRITFTAPVPQGVLHAGLPKAYRWHPKPKPHKKQAPPAKRAIGPASPSPTPRSHR